MSAAAEHALAAQFRAALRKAPASVAVITAGRGETALGATATAVTSVSLDPPALLVCVNRALRLNAAIRAAGLFRVCYLRREQEGVARAFGAPGGARFSAGGWNLDAPAGPDLLPALASIACRLDNAVDCGTHSIFIGHVEAVRCAAGAPLLYCDGAYAGLPERIDA